MCGCELFDELSVLFGLGAEMVLYVGDCEVQLPFTAVGEGMECA